MRLELPRRRCWGTQLMATRPPQAMQKIIGLDGGVMIAARRSEDGRRRDGRRRAETATGAMEQVWRDERPIREWQRAMMGRGLKTSYERLRYT